MTLPYGFRIYVLRAYPNRAAGNDALDVSEGSWASNRIYELLEQAAAEETMYFPPTSPPIPGEPEKPTVTITVGRPVVVRSDLIHVPVAFGEEGVHEHAVRRGKRRRPMEKWSAEAPYYVSFHFPKDQGAEEFMVTTLTYRRRDPIALLFRRLRVIDLQNKKVWKDADEATRAAARERGERPPKPQPYDRLAFERRQAVDNSYIDEILGDAKTATAEFISKEESDRGRGGEIVRRKLVIRLLSDSDRDAGREASRRWVRRQREGETVSMRDGVSELGALLEEHDLLDDGEAARYDKAAVTVRDAQGEGTRIAVDNLKDVFTYRMSEGRPQPIYYYERVAKRLRTVAAQEEIELAEVDHLEVEQCLADSTPDRS